MRELVVRSWLSDEELIITSDEHPFYVLGKGFIPASELKTNDQLVSLEFNLLTVVSNKLLDKPMPMYNFEVGDFHTYAVGESNVWVHNTCIEVNKNVWKALGKKVQNFKLKEKFEAAIKKGFVGPDGKSGIKKLSRGTKIDNVKYSHEVKIASKKRLFGNQTYRVNPDTGKKEKYYVFTKLKHDHTHKTGN